MKIFALVYRSICLNVVCDDEFEAAIKQHFCRSEKIISASSKKPTYTLVVTAHIRTIDGIYHKMVDKWFNYSTLDCWIDNDKKLAISPTSMRIVIQIKRIALFLPHWNWHN